MKHRGFHRDEGWLGGGWLSLASDDEPLMDQVSLGCVLLDAGLTEQEVREIAARIAGRRPLDLFASKEWGRERREKMEELFEAIAEETIGRAQKVKCSVADYREGLQVIIERLKAELRASREAES